MSLLRNGNLEADWSEKKSHRVKVFPSVGDDIGTPYEEDVGNVFTPPGWKVWFRHEEGKWAQPECRDARSKDPDRMHRGEKGFLIFTFGRKQHAGLLQQVSVVPGSRLRLTAHAHAWSNHKDVDKPDQFPHPDDPEWSEGAGKGPYFQLFGTPGLNDQEQNFIFRLGIDPTGGTNPFAGSVVWGQRAHIYNVYHEVPSVEAVAQAPTVTVFLLEKTKWAFKHNDAYWDDVTLMQVEETEPDPEPIEDPPAKGEPREQYERLYVLLPPDGSHKLVTKIAQAFFEKYGLTIGRSADDAGVGNLDKRAVVAVQSLNWIGSLWNFFIDHYPGVQYLPADGENDDQLMGRILASILKARGLSLEYPTTHKPARVTSEFGVERATYMHHGLDLASSYTTYGDEILAAYPGTVIRVGVYDDEDWFGHQVRTRTILLDGSTMYLRYAHMVAGSASVQVGDKVAAGQKLGHPGNTGNSTGDHLHFGVKVGGHYADPEILIVWPADEDPVQPKPDLVHLGMHDDSGMVWMKEKGIRGPALIHRIVGDHPQPVDVSSFAAAGIDVIVRWNFNYGGVGTFPPEAQEDAWVQNVIQSINQSVGVAYHTIGNELNNPIEWVGGFPNPKEILTPERVVRIYNEICHGVRPGILIALGAVDPYNVVAQQFGQPGDPKVWFDVLNETYRYDAILIHAKTQSNDPEQCKSEEMFSHPPLEGRYFQLRAYRNVLNWVPEHMRDLPVYITELNPQLKTDGTMGWDANNAAWVRAAVAEIDEFNLTAPQPITGVCFYRMDAAGDQAGFGLLDRALILDEIVRQANR